jgi:hypothetical protein
MPDTGAPWNIPYVEPSDLVRDYPSDSEDLADAIAAGLSAAGNPGIGSNVVQTVKTTDFTTSSTSYVDITDFDVTITPSSATSKVLLLVDYNVGQTGGNQTRTQLLRDSTVLAVDILEFDFFGSDRQRNRPFHTIVWLDSPATSSAITYKLQIRATGGTARFNVDAQSVPGHPTFTAIEVAV